MYDFMETLKNEDEECFKIACDFCLLHTKVRQAIAELADKYGIEEKVALQTVAEILTAEYKDFEPEERISGDGNFVQALEKGIE